MPATNRYFTDDKRWKAIARRDPRADGAFLYAVKTTGVFCRPTCPSRRPNRANVEFFRTCREAERRGYRACRKCRPNEAPQSLPPAVVQACRMIDGASRPPTLAALARAVGLSPFHFHRLFRSAVGITPKAYADTRRAERFRNGLKQTQPVTQALYAAGYASSSRCYETAPAHLGMTPTAYRQGGAGQSIRYAIERCRLGWVAVAATPRGVCLVEPGDSAKALRARVVAQFPQAEQIERDAELAMWVRQVVAQIDTPAGTSDLPLDLRGTVFQRRVWDALRTIPEGETTTYTAIARKIGRPAAVRAVAGACAANPVAVVIPCHRVLRSDGALGGYRWGIERKQQLLDREACSG